MSSSERSYNLLSGRQMIFALILGNKYVLHIILEAAILLDFFEKKSNKIAASKKLFKATSLAQ